MQSQLPAAFASILLSGSAPSANFAVTARIRGPLTEAALADGLARVLRRHPILALRIAERDGAFYHTAEGVAPVALRIVERVGDDQWVGVVEEAIVRPANYASGPLLGCVWLRGDPSGGEASDLILLFDHSVADGRSGAYVLRDLLELIADPSRPVEPLLPLQTYDLLPPEAIALAAELPRANFPPARPVTLPLRVIPLALGREATAALVARCRAEGTTVQAALCAAFLAPFAAADPRAPLRRVEVPVDIRGRLTAPVGQRCGMFMALAIFGVDCAPGRELWDIARDAGSALRREIDDMRLLAGLAAWDLPDERPEGSEDLFSTMFDLDYDLSISNLGALPIPTTYGPLRLESIYAPTLNVTAAGHRILGVTTFDGRLACTLTSCDDRAPAIAERGWSTLKRMIDQ